MLRDRLMSDSRPLVSLTLDSAARCSATPDAPSRTLANDFDSTAVRVLVGGDSAIALAAVAAIPAAAMPVEAACCEDDDACCRRFLRRYDGPFSGIASDTGTGASGRTSGGCVRAGGGEGVTGLASLGVFSGVLSWAIRRLAGSIVIESAKRSVFVRFAIP